MDFNFTCLKRGLLLAAVASVVVFSAHAQHTGLRGVQPIIFSSPRSDDVVSNLPSLSPKPPESLDLGGVAQAPTFNFNDPSALQPLPQVVSVVSPAEIARRQDLLDRRNNWMLLTPAEILGLATPEKVLGIPERDAFGQPKTSTALERYTERQNLLLAPGTNGLQAGSLSPAGDFFSDRYGTSNSSSSVWGRAEDMANPTFASLLDKPVVARQNENGGWTKLFGQPAATPAPAPNPAQLADMERFRQLLNPGLSSAAPAATPASGGIKTSLPQTLLASGLAQPPPTRAGASFAPLNDGIGKPADLPKLPAIWGLSYTSSSPATAWGPQPAPWLSPSPQPSAAPQRRF